MQNKQGTLSIPLIIIAVALLFLAFNSLYIVDQRQNAVVLQFGNPVKSVLEPGLQAKLPFIQNVEFFDKRIQSVYFTPEGSNKEVMAADQKTMKMTAYAKYRITDPLLFYEKMKNDLIFKRNIVPIIESSIREVVGTFKFKDVLGQQRSLIIKRVIELVNKSAKNFGVEVLGVHIVRINLPDQAKKAVYERMRTDREKEAQEIRANGAEESRKIKAAAEKERTIMLAEAHGKAEMLKGEGDGNAAQIIASAASQDHNFFNFYRSMSAYKKVFNKDSSSIVMTPNNKFLKFMYLKNESTLK